MALRPVKKSFIDDQKKILYVEDSDSNWEVTRLNLADRFDLHRAKDAEEAFREIETYNFDLVLMDIELAGSEFNGIEITKILRGLKAVSPGSRFESICGRYPDLPIIFVTAYSTRYSREELMEAGGNNAVFKPVDFPLLTLILSQLTMQSVRCALETFNNRK